MAWYASCHGRFGFLHSIYCERLIGVYAVLVSIRYYGGKLFWREVWLFDLGDLSEFCWASYLDFFLGDSVGNPLPIAKTAKAKSSSQTISEPNTNLTEQPVTPMRL